jgi:hypothetical protein
LHAAVLLTLGNCHVQSGKKESADFSVSLVCEFSRGPARKERKDLIACFMCYALAAKKKGSLDWIGRKSGAAACIILH